MGVFEALVADDVGAALTEMSDRLVVYNTIIHILLLILVWTKGE